MIKLVVPVWRRPNLTQAQFEARWRGAHADLVKECAKAMGFVRYVQSHKIPSAELEAFARSRGWADACDGLTEVWYESFESMQAAMTSPEGQKASLRLQADELEFCDTARMSAFLTHEHVVFDYTAEE